MSVNYIRHRDYHDDLVDGGWIHVTVRAGDPEDYIKKIRWCLENVDDVRAGWVVRGLKHFYFFKEQHAVLFKLTFGGSA